MSSIFDSIVSIALYPFVSGTYFVTIPFAFILTGFIFALIRRLMVGRF